MNTTIYVFKEFKEDVLKHLKKNEYFTHSSLPVPDNNWLGKTITLPFYSKSGKFIKNKKYVCVMSKAGFKWVEVDPELGKPDMSLVFMDNNNKIVIPGNHIGIALSECVIENEVIVEGELLVVDYDEDMEKEYV